MAKDYVIRISADDKATAAVEKIKANLSKITEPIEKANKRFTSMSDIGNGSLARLEKGFRAVEQSAIKVIDRIVEIIPGLTAIGGAASVAGLTSLATKFGNFGFGLNQTSRLLGMNAQDLAAWHVAAKRAGVSAEEFDSAISGSQMVIRNAAAGGDPQALTLLVKTGTQIARNKNGTVDYYTTQLRLMKAIQAQKTPEAQRALAGAFDMGGLVPMIQQNTYDADKARAYRKGLVPTPQEIAQAKAFHENINDLEDSVTGLGNRIGDGLIPVLGPLITKMSSWLDKNRVAIADKITDAVKKFSDWIKSINWDEVTNKAKDLWHSIGGIAGVAAAVAAITFAGPIGGVLGLIANLTKLSTVAIPEAVTGLGALAGIGLLGLGAGALFTIDKLKDSTEPGHFSGRNAGAPNQKPLRQEDTNAAWWGRTAADAAEFFTIKRGHFVSRSDSNAHGGTGGLDPLGIRSNNPLNMSPDGVEAVYATPEEGIAAGAANLRKGYRGLTVAQIVDKWTGGTRTGNTPEQTANYIGLVSKASGFGADQIPNLDRASAVIGLIKGQIRAENGQQPYSDEQLAGGVGQVMSGVPNGDAPIIDTGLVQPKPEPSDGTIIDTRRDANVAALQKTSIDVTFHNVPPGVRPEAKNSDGGTVPTKIRYVMDGV